MEETTSGVRIELRINGETVTTGGVGPYGVLTAMLCWMQRNPSRMDQYAAEATPEEREALMAPELRVEVSALDSTTEEHRFWPGFPLAVGDEVTLRVLAPGAIDDFVTTPPGGG
jgi:hypothetical protein